MRISLACFVAIVAAVCTSGSAEAQLLYSFEGENDPNGINANVEGFFGTSTAFTITQDTIGIGATEGTNSMKVFLAKGPGFVGARTATIPAGLTDDPNGVNAILFDVTIEPGDEYMGGFSVIGITIFGDDDGQSVQEQYVDEEHVDGLAAGTHTFQVDLDVSHNGNSFSEVFFTGGPTITLFQFLFNQSPGAGPGADDVIVYIDNVRIAGAVVIDADFNGDNVVDGLDFLIYQRNMGIGTTQPEGDANGDGMIDNADLQIWEDNYGSTLPLAAAMATVPEPTSVALFGVCAMILSSGVRRRIR